MRNLVLFAAVSLLIAGAATKFADRFDVAPIVAPDAAAGTPARADTVVVPGDRGGHFTVNVSIGGRSLAFLVDTGASTVVLKRDDARQLGINLNDREYVVPVQTANGVTYAARVRLRNLKVGPISVNNVEALVAKPGTLKENLLGMSFLSRLRSYEFSGEFLTLRS